MKPLQSRSFVVGTKNYGRTGTEDEDTDEVQVHKVFRLTESTCPSPNLWRRDLSTLASFASVPNPSDDDLTARVYPPKASSESHPEVEIKRIKQESEEAKDYLREFARNLHARAEEVRSNSALSVNESRAMRGYLGRLGKKLDKLLEEAEETEKALAEDRMRMKKRGLNPFSASTSVLNQSSEANQSFEQRLMQLEQTTASLLRVQTCALEDENTAKPACCGFFGF